MIHANKSFKIFLYSPISAVYQVWNGQYPSRKLKCKNKYVCCTMHGYMQCFTKQQ